MSSKLFISKLISKSSAILHSDGNKVYQELIDLSKPNQKIELDFTGLDFCTTSFLNASIGAFFMNVPNAKSILEFEGIDGKTSLKMKIAEVIELATNQSKREIQSDINMNYHFA